MYAVIVGSGPAARTLGNRLMQESHNLTFVVEDLRAGEQIADQFPRALVIRGACTDASTLEHARVQDCDAFFAMDEDDGRSMVAALLASERFKVPHVVALSHSCEHTPAFAALSIQTVCEPVVVAESLLAGVGADGDA